MTLPSPPPDASYRLQLTPDFGFEAARRQLERLQAVGISHVYLSPVTEATPGSTHGYDVTDHTRVRDQLGGLDGLTKLLDSLVERGMAAVVDHVANHAAVGRPDLNRPWWEMLRDGPGSAADRWFDVDWSAADGHVLLPVIDRPVAELVDTMHIVSEGDVAGPQLRVGDFRLPLAAGTEHLAPLDALDRQHYRLIEWRRPERNVRRFFTIDSLVAVRVEHPEVAAAVDTVPRLLVEHPGFGGLRIDHIDGLADPLAYLHGLRDLLGDRWLVVEKILAPGETLPPSWPVDGTTGYDHARVLEHALLDRAGWSGMRRTWAAAVDDSRPFREWELQARHEVLATGLRPDVERVAAVAARALTTSGDVVEAVTQLSARLGRYRTYLPDDDEGRVALANAASEAVASRPDLAATIDALAAVIASPSDDAGLELRTRWQQLTGPAMAKGVEDRVFWRYLPLASLGEVGGDPDPSAAHDAVGDLHRHHATTQLTSPTTMLAGTTHDAKRSDDVRAFGLALAARPEHWARVADEWMSTAAFTDLDAAAQWLALQTVATAPDLSADRLEAYLVKAAREADLHTSWIDPDAHYERRLGALARDVLAWPPLAELAASLDRPGCAVSLGMLAVRATAPGVPDVYQGTEAFRFLLVDPDNRTQPDHAALDDIVERAATVDGRAAWVEPGAPLARAVVLRRLLALRRDLREVFGPGGGYEPLGGDDGMIAFARLDGSGRAGVVTAIARPGSAGGVVTLPAGRWRHVLVDDEPPLEGQLDLSAALTAFPAVVLVTA